MQLHNPIAKEVNIHIQIVEPLSSSIIKADYERLMEVMSNLLSNAIKFSSPEGKITISTQDLKGFVRVLVSDEGKGISKSEQSRVFLRFVHYGVHSSLPGIGIGLSLCKAVIESLGGTIAFTSEPGKGSVFYFDLPICKESI